MDSETLQFILTLSCGGLAGSVLTQLVQKYNRRLQIMKCYYLEDDIQSKIPLAIEDGTMFNNVYFKRFKIKNTTNKDIEHFKVIFQFDNSGSIIDCSTSSKEGINHHKIKRNSQNKNAAEATINNFNREDEIEFYFRLGDISNNEYYIKEKDCLGFKIKCIDKRHAMAKSKSTQSNTVIIQSPVTTEEP